MDELRRNERDTFAFDRTVDRQGTIQLSNCKKKKKNRYE